VRSYRGILIPQTLYELHDERRGHGALVVMSAHQRVRVGCLAVDAEQAVGNHIGLLTCDAAADNAARGATHVLHEHDAQRDGDRPELTNGERLHALIGAHEPTQCFRIEAAVGVRHVRPGDTEHARVAREVAIRKFRQLPIEPRRQINANLADLLFDDVIVVEQPTRRRA